MWQLKDAVAAAINTSGKSAARIARDAGMDQDTISDMKTGANVNPTLETLTKFANAAGTTVIALLGGGSSELSREDEDHLTRHLRWIESKLATIDALGEPNAKILEAPPAEVRKIAEAQRADNPFADHATLRLRAIGQSMIRDGILPDDTLYATPPDASGIPPVGKIIACRIGEGVFVKRLESEHGRRLLLSAHPSYQPIAVDAAGLTLDILGVVIGRVGRVW